MRRLVEAARVGHLATVTPAGRPHLVPCCFALSGQVAYTPVDAKPKSTLALQRIRNVESVSSVSLLVDRYDDDHWSALWWVRVDGTARVLRPGDGPRDADERHHALELLATKYRQYVEQAPPGPVIAIDISRWRGWSAA